MRLLPNGDEQIFRRRFAASRTINQKFQNLGIAVGGSEIQRGQASGLPPADVRSPLQQQRRNRRIRIHCRRVQRRPPAAVLSVHVRAGSQQHRRYGRIRVQRRRVQRCPPVCILRRQFRAPLQQQCRYGRILVQRSNVQRPLLFPIRLVNGNLGISKVQQRPRHLRIRIPHRDMQRRNTVREVQLRTPLDQEQRRRRIAIAPENPSEKSLQIGCFQNRVSVAAESRQGPQAIPRHEPRPVAPEQTFDWHVRQSLGGRCQPEPAAHCRV